jgi:outer membrane biosynthesis protein TonB
MDRFINLRGLPVMRQIVAIALLYFAATLGVSAADNNEVQQGIFDSYLKLANEGDVVAQYVVAQRYENGKGTGKDMEKAYYWYEMAAKQNYPLALVKLEARDHQNTVKAEPPAAAKTPIAPAESTPAPTPPPAAVKKEPAKKPAPAPSQPKPKPAKAPEVTTAAVTADASPRPAKPARAPGRTETGNQNPRSRDHRGQGAARYGTAEAGYQRDTGAARRKMET